MKLLSFKGKKKIIIGSLILAFIFLFIFINSKLDAQICTDGPCGSNAGWILPIIKIYDSSVANWKIEGYEEMMKYENLTSGWHFDGSSLVSVESNNNPITHTKTWDIEKIFWLNLLIVLFFWSLPIFIFLNLGTYFNIFSLKTKKHLFGWSLILGLLFSILFFYFFGYEQFTAGSPEAHFVVGGWPLLMRFYFVTLDGKFSFFDLFKNLTFFLDWFFWAVIVLIVLSLVRHFGKKNRNESLSVKA